ncbi:MULTISPECIES: hypothetical protein [unclassified Bacillus (in: firmicutes)]|uniref:hypothetical protein n=1 Tax=unclassified Bacillus (in: firmicutes) TaxID=185979 RepID=UPI001BEA770B|nr:MULTISPECIES: hypothetical protein [unclassified Bacillus (in: firmicutes)]MBT2619130.1 hypothetical protein [Bacillus sp. ISL-78]MBT2627803.1 hypothetical protein [Bacillus sp. ISL-101]
MKKLITSLFIFCFLATGIVSNASAEADELFKTPIIKQSDQWKIEIKKAKETAKTTNNKFERYYVVITNIGKDLDSVEFNTYRNEPNTETKYGLSINDLQYEKFNQGQVFEFPNFPISSKSRELQFEISWHEKPHSKEVQGRKYKETFTFTPIK